MKLTTHANSPLHPLAERARTYSNECDEFWVASAFISDDAIADVVGSALDAGATVRLMTGTFGCVTRLRTFEGLWKLAQTRPLSVRIGPSDFHVKLYLWRSGGTAQCWIGSANLTRGGLQDLTELVAEIEAPWDSASIRPFRVAFEQEWGSASDLDEKFLSTYREAPREVAAAHLGKRSRPKVRTTDRQRTQNPMIVLPVSRHYAEEGAAAQRIQAKLSGSAEHWYRASARQVRAVTPGTYCLMVDTIDGDIQLGLATDTAEDGSAFIVAYDLVLNGEPVSLTATRRHVLSSLGLKPTAKGFGTQWLDHGVAAAVVEQVWGRRRGARVLKTLR